MKLRYLTVTCLLLAVSIAYGQELRNYDAYYTAKPVASSNRASTANIPGRVAHLDSRQGVPSFIWADRAAVGQAPYGAITDVARWYLGRFASAYRLNRASLSTVYASHVHDTGRGGIIVSFQQRVDGVDVVRNRLNVLMTRSHGLIAITGNLHDAAVPTTHAYRLSPEHATAYALSDLAGAPVSRQAVVDTSRRRAGYGYYEVSAAPELTRADVALTESVRVKKILYPLPDRLVPGYYVEVIGNRISTPDMIGYGYGIAADDGRTLLRENLVASEAYNYRVWAENDVYKTPSDGPQTEYTPHPTGIPDRMEPDFIPSALVAMEGFNTNPMGEVDPWLRPGATETLGNNVDAYADLEEGDGFNGSDLRADTNFANTFDYVFDTALAPASSADQIKASVTQLFYTNNWLHDYFYDSGFDEAAGNAQEDNYGRGGAAGDPVHAQAQDYSGTNNANMLTPNDGGSPRMQMYVWNNADFYFSALGMTFQPRLATFSPQIFELSSNIVLVDDGVDTSTDACEPIQNDLTGMIALIDRGSCNFDDKAGRAETAGAIAVIIANHTPNVGAPGVGGDPPPIVNIPTISVSFEFGAALKDALANGDVPASMGRSLLTDRDGTIDNGIVSHEWAHYMFGRLTNCNTLQCGGTNEGWADFIALMTMIREGDAYNGSYAVAGYSTALLGDAPYFGIRRIPYSSEPMHNDLSFRHISDGELLPNEHPVNYNGVANSAVHNAGEVWSTMMHEAYVALLQKTVGAGATITFNEMKRRMADYVVAGMKLMPTNATITEQRDSVMAAALARDFDDYLTIAQAFAERGAGTCAVSPPEDSGDLTGVVEDFEVHGEMDIVSVRLDDSITTCDYDGHLDAGESGFLTVTVRNVGPGELSNTDITVSSSNPNVTFPNGAAASIGSISPHARGSAMIEVAASELLTVMESVTVTINSTNEGACTQALQESLTTYVHYDARSTTTDTVEADVTTWTKLGNMDTVWSRVEDMNAAGNRVWFGVNLDANSDTNIESPPIQVAATGALVVSFDHRHQFEADPGQNWDGAVVEISTDGGLTWRDVSAYADPTYGGTIITGTNPLNERPAYVGQSLSWPDFQNEQLNFGTALAGQTIRLRFRIGTDSFVGAFGWEIDNIAIAGAENAPFADVIDENGICGATPIADAGPDANVASGDTVVLDASASADPDGDLLAFSWSQMSGPTVALTEDMATATFTAPDVMMDTVLTFEVTVDDGENTDMDTVDITVSPAMGGADAGVDSDAGIDPGDPDSGCCQTGARLGSGDIALMLLAMCGILATTRRRRDRHIA